MTGRIVIEQMLNNDYLYLHLSFELETDAHGPRFMRPLREEGGYWDQLGTQAKDLVRRLMSVDGVQHVALDAYNVRIKKAQLFDFNTMAEALRPLLREVFGADTEIIIKAKIVEPAPKAVSSEIIVRTPAKLYKLVQVSGGSAWAWSWRRHGGATTGGAEPNFWKAARALLCSRRQHRRIEG